MGTCATENGPYVTPGCWNCRRAKDLMQSNINILHKTAAVLMEKEQIDGEEFQKIVAESQAEQYLKEDDKSVTIPYRKAAVV